MRMNGDQNSSDAVWIRQQPGAGNKPRHNSFDFGPGSGSPLGRFGFSRSMSVNSEGASTQDSSPPYSPVDMSSSSSVGKSKALNIPMDRGGRSRTSSFSSGYGPSYGHDREELEKDPYLIHSPLSTSAPGMFRRSNSISVGALEYQNQKYQDSKYGQKTGGGPGGQLGPIDEIGKMYNFGDAFKKSVGALFNAPKMPPKPTRNFGDNGKDQGKKKGQMTDRVVSMLCESAIR